MWIIKVGGSLATSPALVDWLRYLAADTERRWLIVPGGGPYADAVRAVDAHWQLPARESHRLAIHAMGLFARQLQALEPRLPLLTTRPDLAAIPGSAIWLPHPDLLPGLSEGWDVTADSIALWLAQQWSAEGLVLLKAVPPPETNLAGLAEVGYLDPNFPSLHAARQPVPVFWASSDSVPTASVNWSAMPRLAW